MLPDSLRGTSQRNISDARITNSESTRMNLHAQALADFRSQVTKLLQERDKQWESSRRLVGAGQLPTTLKRLVEEVQRVELSSAVRDAILTALNRGQVERIQDLPGPRLKELTGLPPTKAVRALCVWFDLADHLTSQGAAIPLSQAALDAVVRDRNRPFDVLLMTETPSLLDLGAGDLSFASELAVSICPADSRAGQEVDTALPGSFTSAIKTWRPIASGKEALGVAPKQAGSIVSILC